MIFKEGFKEVDATVFYTFIKDNNLVAKDNFMDTDYYNDKEEVEAIRQHGLAYDQYYIKSDKEYSTLKFVTQLINGKG